MNLSKMIFPFLLTAVGAACSQAGASADDSAQDDLGRTADGVEVADAFSHEDLSDLSKTDTRSVPDGWGENIEQNVPVAECTPIYQGTWHCTGPDTRDCTFTISGDYYGDCWLNSDDCYTGRPGLYFNNNLGSGFGFYSTDGTTARWICATCTYEFSTCVRAK